MLAQDEHLKGELILLQQQFLLSLETAKAERKLQNEIFPDLLRSRNYQRNKMGFEQMEEDLAKALRGEPNAEWGKMMGNKQLADNMKEIIAMGKEGIDINLETFLRAQRLLVLPIQVHTGSHHSTNGGRK